MKDMSSGYFDKAKVENCTLSTWKLAGITTSAKKEINEAKWKKIFVFDEKKNKLKISKYSGLDSKQFDGAKVLFKAVIDPTDKGYLTKESAHLFTIKVEEEIVEAEAAPVEETEEEEEKQVVPNEFNIKPEVEEEPEPEPEIVEPKEEKVKPPPKKIKSPPLKFRMDWTKLLNPPPPPPPVKKQGPGGSDEVKEYVRPPEPPEMRKMTLGSKGEFRMEYSQDLDYPQYFQDLFAQ